MSYTNRVEIDDGAYQPGYRGDELKKVSQKVLYQSEARDYNPVGDEINSYIAGESYLSSVNDIAVMENDDITKVAPYHKPIQAPVFTSNSDTVESKTDVSLWFIFFIIIVVVFGCMLFDIKFDTDDNSNN